MPLTNAQYDSIMREYQKKQLRNQHSLDRRIQEVYGKSPRLRELDALVASSSVAKAKSLLEGKSDALASLREDLGSIAAERRELLRQLGYPENYLTRSCTCQDCQDTGYIGSEKCHCFQQSAIDLLYARSNIKSILEYENFDNFSYDFYSGDQINEATGLSALETIKMAVRQCYAFIEDFDREFRNILFYGDTGVGKTFLSHCIARELLRSSHSVLYFTAFELFDIFAKNTFDKDADAGEQYAYIFNCDLLIIDDLGTELTNAFVSSQLFLCVNERLLRKKSTIISTNLSLGQLVQTYSERTFSRISSQYALLKLIGKDIRLMKKISPVRLQSEHPSAGEFTRNADGRPD